MNANIDDRTKTLMGLGTISMIGLTVILVIFNYLYGVSYIELASDVILLFAHPNQLVIPEHPTVLEVIMNCSGIIVLDMAMALVLIILSTALASMARALLGDLAVQPVQNYKKELLQELIDKGPLAIFVTVLGEEAIARGIVMGILWQGVFHSHPTLFYVLFFLGNGLWAIIHLANYKKDRSLLLVIPQFLKGILYTYLFVKYGLWAVMLSHFYSNTIIMATMKEQMPDETGNPFNFVYYLALTVSMIVLMFIRGLGFGDLNPWLVNSELAPLAGYSWIDYAIILLTLIGLTNLIAAALALDNETLDAERWSPLSFWAGDVGLPIVLMLATVFIANWLLGFLVDSPVTRALILSIAWALMSNTKSGSAMARETLVELPSIFFLVTAVTVLGFIPTMGLGLAFGIANYLPWRAWILSQLPARTIWSNTPN